MSVHPFIEAEKQAGHSVKRACELLEVPRAAYYARRTGTPGPRAVRDAELTGRITEVHTASRDSYGAPRVHAALKCEGEQCGRRRVARLMREAGLRGRYRRRRRRTTVPDPHAASRPDLVLRNFQPDPAAVDARWCGDITYLATEGGWLYLATVIDIASRRVDGRPGDFIGDRPVNSVIQPAGRPTTHLSDQECCNDWLNPGSATFGRAYANGPRRRWPRPGDTWHLDEVFVQVNDELKYLWRAVDQDGNVLDILLQSRRDKAAARRFFHRLIRKTRTVPRVVVTDEFRSCSAAHREVMPAVEHRSHKDLNNQTENSHQPTRQRERAMKGFPVPSAGPSGSWPRSAASHPVNGVEPIWVHPKFDTERHLAPLPAYATGCGSIQTSRACS